MSVQTNFRAEDMLGVAKAVKPVAKPVVKPARVAPVAEVAPVVEDSVEILVVEEAVEAPAAEEQLCLPKLTLLESRKTLPIFARCLMVF